MSNARMLPDEEATLAWARGFATQLRPGDVVLLQGPLGAGKTTFVRGLVGGLGGDPREVCSPTFILLETYDLARGGVRRLHHVDLYRLEGKADAVWHEMGLGEALDDPDAVVAVEWPDRAHLPRLEGRRVLIVGLDPADGGRRASWSWE